MWLEDDSLGLIAELVASVVCLSGEAAPLVPGEMRHVAKAAVLTVRVFKSLSMENVEASTSSKSCS